jgi:hypothetical protein
LINRLVANYHDSTDLQIIHIRWQYIAFFHITNNLSYNTSKPVIFYAISTLILLELLKSNSGLALNKESTPNLAVLEGGGCPSFFLLAASFDAAKDLSAASCLQRKLQVRKPKRHKKECHHQPKIKRLYKVEWIAKHNCFQIKTHSLFSQNRAKPSAISHTPFLSCTLPHLL